MLPGADTEPPPEMVSPPLAPGPDMMKEPALAMAWPLLAKTLLEAMGAPKTLSAGVLVLPGPAELEVEGGVELTGPRPTPALADPPDTTPVALVALTPLRMKRSRRSSGFLRNSGSSSRTT